MIKYFVCHIYIKQVYFTIVLSIWNKSHIVWPKETYNPELSYYKPGHVRACRVSGAISGILLDRGYYSRRNQRKINRKKEKVSLYISQIQCRIFIPNQLKKWQIGQHVCVLSWLFVTTDYFSQSACYCSGSLEPESSCHDRDWIMELPMEADILTFTGILTPEDASVASCFPFDITISLSRFPLLSIPPLHSAIPQGTGNFQVSGPSL